MGTVAYMDNNATTPISAAALRRMEELLHGLPGNAASMHQLGIAARDCLEEARERFARHLGGALQIVFTSGATEANGLCLLGALRHPANRCEQLVVSELEHSSVYAWPETCKDLAPRLDSEHDPGFGLAQLAWAELFGDRVRRMNLDG